MSKFNYITSKTHRYIAIRRYPSNYILKKFHKHEIKALKQFNAYYERYLEFYQELFEFITGEKSDDFRKKYMFGFRDCSKEEIHEHTGIMIACADNDDVFCIPKNPENDRIYNYILENVPPKCKYKVLKKTRGTYMDHGISTLHRDMCKPLTKGK